jgi:hypothetical protein
MKRGLLLLCASLVLACPPPPTGTRCAQHTDCRAMAEGYCSRAELCTRVCDMAACPTDYRCSAEGKRRVCLPACESDTNCVEGFRCEDGSDGKVCRLAEPLKQLPMQQ